MLRIIFVLAALTACGDNKPGETPPDVTPDAAPDAPQARGACVDRPTDLPRPPTAGEPLACDMLPPGFAPP